MKYENRANPVPVKNDLTGKKFGYLEVLLRAPNDKYGVRYWVRCICGTEKSVSACYLNSGTYSCGCRGKGTSFKARKRRIPQPWTPEQLENLKLWWPIIPIPEMQRRFNRTASAIRVQAYRMKLEAPRRPRTEGRAPEWTEAEDNVLREHYPNGGSQVCLRYLPTRSKHAIRDRAKVIKVKCPPNKKEVCWTDEEVAVLEKYYPKGGSAACIPYLRNRTHEAVRDKVQKIGVRRYAFKRVDGRRDCSIEAPLPESGFDRMRAVSA